MHDDPISILVVEDDVHLARAFTYALQLDGATVIHAATAEQGMECLHAGIFDLIILDINLPGRDGVWFVETVRGERRPTPIIVTSGRGDDADVSRALDAGADAYLVKPLSSIGLAARVRAFARRHIKPPAPERVTFGPLTLDESAMTIAGEAGMVTLTGKEFALLKLFLENAGKVFSRDELLSEIWGYQFDPGTSVLDIAIHRLRRKLRQATLQVEVGSRRGAGFMLVPWKN